jgi:hypothetical protein
VAFRWLFLWLGHHGGSCRPERRPPSPGLPPTPKRFLLRRAFRLRQVLRRDKTADGTARQDGGQEKLSPPLNYPTRLRQGFRLRQSATARQDGAASQIRVNPGKSDQKKSEGFTGHSRRSGRGRDGSSECRVQNAKRKVSAVPSGLGSDGVDTQP